MVFSTSAFLHLRETNLIHFPKFSYAYYDFFHFISSNWCPYGSLEAEARLNGI
jgi:hypothetical protein